MKAWKLILAALVLFVAGAVAGSAVTRLRDKASAKAEVNKRGPLPPQVWQRVEFLRRAQRDLDLKPEQRERIEGFVRESQESFRKLWEPIAPQVREQFDALRERIRTELSPEQRERFDQYLRERSTRKGDGKGESRAEDGRERRKTPPENPPKP